MSYTPTGPCFFQEGYLLVEVSSEPGSKKVTFLPSPGFFTGVLKIKKRDQTTSLKKAFPKFSRCR